jgi:hypothetical protein
MLHQLAIGPADEVVEFAPGLGVTARMILQRRPQCYTAVERHDGQLPSHPEYPSWSGKPITQAYWNLPQPWSSARPC